MLFTHSIRLKESAASIQTDSFGGFNLEEVETFDFIIGPTTNTLYVELKGRKEYSVPQQNPDGSYVTKGGKVQFRNKEQNQFREVSNKEDIIRFLELMDAPMFIEQVNEAFARFEGTVKSDE